VDDFYVGIRDTGGNVAHKVRRYTKLFVASELVSDVEVGISDGFHARNANNKLRFVRRISALATLANRGIQRGFS